LQGGGRGENVHCKEEDEERKFIARRIWRVCTIKVYRRFGGVLVSWLWDEASTRKAL